MSYPGAFDFAICQFPAPYVLTISHRELAEEESRVQTTQLEDTYLLTIEIL